MRFMVIVKATKSSEAGEMPSLELLEAMGAYNQQLVDAGVMQAGEGLQPSSKGARVYFRDSDRWVVDGPFTETNELIAGFWLWKCASLEEAIEWAKKCPNPMPEEVPPRDPAGFRGRGFRSGGRGSAGAGREDARADRGEPVGFSTRKKE